MNFASDEFLVFLPIVFVLHWALGRSAFAQNAILLLASYFFYACWDPRFLPLLIGTTLWDYWAGRRVGASPPASAGRNFWLISSVVLNLGILGFFKYANWFLDSLSSLGFSPWFQLYQVILPVGISFYIFHTLGYVADVYTGRTRPATDWLGFALFVAFFAQLVAGPISRAASMLVQFANRRIFCYETAAEGFRIILWGYFKKLVVADNCGTLVDAIWQHPEASGAVVWVGAVLFSLQIYADFSGYSDIAVGLGRLFGIQLTWNFRYPYFAGDPREFWRRWHISLSTCFRDYVYVPLGGNQRLPWLTLMITFALSGLWHGANWTFVVWGLLHGLACLFWRLRNRAATFAWVTVTWVFFRAPNLEAAADFFVRACQPTAGWQLLQSSDQPLCLLLGLVTLGTLELLAERWGWEFPLEPLKKQTLAVRWACYVCLLAGVYLLGNFHSEYDFIYFQF